MLLAEKPSKKSAPSEKPVKPKKETKSMAKCEKKQLAAIEFSVSIKINTYGFIGLRNGLLVAMGRHKNMALRINRNPEGRVAVRKV